MRIFSRMAQQPIYLKLSMEALREICGERVVIRGIWPPRLPCLSVCDFDEWGNFKQTVYKKKNCNLEAHQNEIRSIIFSVTEDEVQRVFQNFLRLWQMCFDADTHHFQQFR
jgi:hypothetical protein